MKSNVTDHDIMPPSVFLTEKQAGEVLQVSPRTLQGWRLRGIGPKFVRFSARGIRYRRMDIEAWAASRLVSSTSQKL